MGCGKRRGPDMSAGRICCPASLEAPAHMRTLCARGLTHPDSAAPRASGLSSTFRRKTTSLCTPHSAVLLDDQHGDRLHAARVAPSSLSCLEVGKQAMRHDDPQCCRRARTISYTSRLTGEDFPLPSRIVHPWPPTPRLATRMCQSPSIITNCALCSCQLD